VNRWDESDGQNCCCPVIYIHVLQVRPGIMSLFVVAAVLMLWISDVFPDDSDHAVLGLIQAAQLRPILRSA